MNSIADERWKESVPGHDGMALSAHRCGRTAGAVGLLAVLLPCLSSAARAQDYTYEVVNDTSITITGYTGVATVITVPATLEGLPVTAIGDYAFYSRADLAGITLPDSTISIGEYAFSDCSGLASFAIPNEVAVIGRHAFVNCTGLSSVLIPNRVTVLERATFAGCSSLTNITIGNSVTAIGEHAFNHCGNLPGITIPEGVTSIGNNAFAFCSKLTSVSMPDTVTTLGDRAFYNCPSLTGITIPDSVISIGRHAFALCTNLAYVTIGQGVTGIAPYTFNQCDSLARVTIPAGATAVGSYAFAYCDNLKGLYFEGNAPGLDGDNVFTATSEVTIFHLPGATGWTDSYGGRPTVLWNPQVPVDDPGFGMQPNNQFGFAITSPDDFAVTVEACNELTFPSWTRLSTLTLSSGAAYFIDSDSALRPGRFYRLRMPR